MTTGRSRSPFRVRGFRKPGSGVAPRLGRDCVTADERHVLRRLSEGVDMASESGDVGQEAPTLSGVAPGLAGVHGGLRLEVAGKPVGTLVVEGTHVELTPDTTGDADATVVCSSD